MRTTRQLSKGKVKTVTQDKAAKSKTVVWNADAPPSSPNEKQYAKVDQSIAENPKDGRWIVQLLQELQQRMSTVENGRSHDNRRVNEIAALLDVLKPQAKFLRSK